MLPAATTLHVDARSNFTLLVVPGDLLRHLLPWRDSDLQAGGAATKEMTKKGVAMLAGKMLVEGDFSTC